MTEASRQVLAELKALPVRSLAPEAFVFGIAKPWTTHWINDRWHKVLQLAKVRYRNPEQLRHTWASTMLSRNAPVLYVQKQGGWKSAEILFRVYARWLPQEPFSAGHAEGAADRNPGATNIGGRS
jgi:integrase